jgi:predicted dehydrogenase
LIGAGAISPAHVSALRMIPGIQLVAVCDRIPGRASRLAEQFAIPDVFSSADEMLETSGLNVVHVLTPPQFHIEAAIAAVRAKCHVLVEKPLCLSPAECEELLAETAGAGLIGAVNHSMTHHPVIDRLIALIRRRKLGRVHHVSVHFSAPPEDLPLSDPGNFMFQCPENIMFEFGPHPMSVIRLLMGGINEGRTIASGERNLSGSRRFFDTWQCQLVCERGTASLYLALGRSLRQAVLCVIGEDGTAQVDLLRGTLHLMQASPRAVLGPIGEALRHGSESLSVTSAELFYRWASALHRPILRRRDLFVRSLNAFYEGVRGGQKPREDFEAGRTVVQYCETAAENVTFLA